jgi:hypothetical protein
MINVSKLYCGLAGDQHLATIFHHGTYTINIGHGPPRKSLHAIKAIDPSDNKTLTIVF